MESFHCLALASQISPCEPVASARLRLLYTCEPGLTRRFSTRVMLWYSSDSFRNISPTNVFENPKNLYFTSDRRRTPKATLSWEEGLCQDRLAWPYRGGVGGGRSSAVRLNFIGLWRCLKWLSSVMGMGNIRQHALLSIWQVVAW